MHRTSSTTPGLLLFNAVAILWKRLLGHGFCLLWNDIVGGRFVRWWSIPLIFNCLGHIPSQFGFPMCIFRFLYNVHHFAVFSRTLSFDIDSLLILFRRHLLAQRFVAPPAHALKPGISLSGPLVLNGILKTTENTTENDSPLDGTEQEYHRDND